VAAWWAAQQGALHRGGRTWPPAVIDARSPVIILVAPTLVVLLVISVGLISPYLVVPLITIIFALVAIPALIKGALLQISVFIKFAIYVTTFVLLYELYLLGALILQVLASLAQ
jgi:hypothetical protein